MLWIKAFHIIFMVTWFAGLLLVHAGYRTSCPVPASLRAVLARTRSRSQCSRAAIPGG